MPESPSSSMLTYLFTDLENSTHLWEHYPKTMQGALARHDVLLKQAVETHRGRLVKNTGDGIFAAFESPADGVAAALAVQEAITSETWPAETGPLKVRIGVHTGESQAREGDYYGPEINLAARVMSLGYGGQVLISEALAALVRHTLPKNCSLADLGEHWLKGIAVPKQIFQLCHPILVPEFPPLKSLSAYKHNLHRPLSNFIGREKELTVIKESLQKTQLLTLLGPGGTGKTRLMLQAAEEMIEDYPDGVWLVELAPLTDPNLIAERVAAALNVQEQPGRTLLAALTEYLRRKEMLLLLDNVEHLVREAALFTEGILKHCPRLKILVTGREALFIPGEITIQIPSLSLPDEKQEVNEIGSSEGVQLFLERARAVRPDFQLTGQNASTIAEIVRRLDGIPLALELAAARLRMLTVEQINARLNDRFRLLTGGSRTALPRQQTLQALIDWSWRLLDEKEHILLRRLSIFSGGWNLESAQAVAGFDLLDAFDVFDLMEQLINKSLVKVEYPSTGEARYSMLESIRQFSQEKLFDTGEGIILRGRSADYFTAFALQAEKHMRLDSMVPWVNRITQERDNLRSVLDWTLPDQPHIALRISAALLYNWATWIHPSEAFAWLDEAIKQTRSLVDLEDTPVLIQDFIKALYAIAFTHALLGQDKIGIKILDEAITQAEKHGQWQYYCQSIAQKTSMMVQHWQGISPDWIQKVEETVEMSEEKGFDWESSFLHGVLFSFHVRQGSFEQAMRHFQEYKVVVEKNRNPRSLAILLVVQARIAVYQGKLEAARVFYRQAAEAFSAINDQRFTLLCRSDLSHVIRRSGQLEEALPVYRETIIKWQEQGNPVAVAHQLECFAYIAIAKGQFEHAARLLGAARKTREQLDAVSSNPQEAAELKQALAQLAGSMGETAMEKHMAAGAEMKLDDAVLFALGEFHPA